MDFESKMLIFENRIAEYIDVFEKRKRRKSVFADQRTRTRNDKMSACMIHNPNWTSRTVKPVAKQGLFAVGYESTGRTS